MKKRFRQHINPLKKTSLIPKEPLVLPVGPKVEVELGCGDARFLIELAQQNPTTLYIGLDIRNEFLAVAKQRSQEQKISNLFFQTSNLIIDLQHIFPPGRIQCFYINFPDPWFKRRHKNRRWLTSKTLSSIVDALESEGKIFYQTDVWSLALESLCLLESNAQLLNVENEWSFLHKYPFTAQSSRDLCCQKEKRKIWRMLFVKKCV